MHRRHLSFSNQTLIHVWVERISQLVAHDLKASSINVRHPSQVPRIAPSWHKGKRVLSVSRWCAKEENRLTRYPNTFFKQPRKYLSQPRATRKDVRSCRDLVTAF